jgi:RHS repeat-associated protein
VKVAVGNVITAYVGNLYEVNPTSGVTTTYYFLNGQRVAMRTATGVTWLQGDHLGSASLTTNSGGTRVSEERYYPYGATRVVTGTMATDYQFTGQKNDTGTGLYYYGARYYDPVSGRFISADTIVPSPRNPQDLNRYAYVRNNPVRHTDPTGHCILGCLGDIAVGGTLLFAGLAASALWSTWYLATQRENVQSAIADVLKGSWSDPVVKGDTEIQNNLDGQSGYGKIPGPVPGGGPLPPWLKKGLALATGPVLIVYAALNFKSPDSVVDESLGAKPKPVPAVRPTPTPTRQSPPGTPVRPSWNPPPGPNMYADPNAAVPPRPPMLRRPPGRELE